MTSPDEMNNEMDGYEEGDTNRSGGNTHDAVPRPKRIACILCRKRKLRCDGNKPSCATCSRLNHNCEYSEERKKSGPKRGYVKLLEARLKQVENMLETRDSTNDPTPQNAVPEPTMQSAFGIPSVPGLGDGIPAMMQESNFAAPALDGVSDFAMGNADNFSWEMIGLGLEEALPSRDIIDDLNEIYFDKIHPSLPMIHKARFLASMDLAPHLRPAVCLRYAMWTHACVVTPKYSAYTEHFYARARKYAEMDEMRGHGEGMITIGHSQAWTLIGCYEFKLMYFPRAWMSIGRAARLAQMMGLHRQDRVGLDVKQTLPPPRDWTDREERRRTFWMAYCQDRYASIGTGWPMVMDEQDILTNLPASEDAFRRSQPEPTLQLADIMSGEGAASLSSFGGVILLSTIYGRNLTHLHRPVESDNDHDLNGAFWKRHRTLDNILLNTSLALPANLRLPAGLNDPNTIFLNMNIHTATICLHQAAIFKADKNRLPAQISAESKRRCIVAADQVTNIMKMISHLDMSLMNPFLAFCLYVSSRVFVQYLKARRDDTAVKSSLHFLLAAMQVLKAKNPLTESFLVQLDVDLEGSGLDLPTSYSRWRFGHRPAGEIPENTDSMKCSPLFEIRQTQGQAEPGGQVQGVTWQQDSRTGTAQTTSDYPSLYGTDTSVMTNPAMEAGLQGEGFENFYGFSIRSVGSQSSPDNSHNESSGSRPHSNQPTPSTSSIHNSSNTSYPSPVAQSNGSTKSGTSQTQQQQSINSAYSGSSAWTSNIATTSSMVAPDLQSMMNSMTGTGMTPNATGMTPLNDVWPTEGMGDGNDWMFGWPGATPQPQ